MPRFLADPARVAASSGSRRLTSSATSVELVMKTNFAGAHARPSRCNPFRTLRNAPTIALATSLGLPLAMPCTSSTTTAIFVEGQQAIDKSTMSVR